MFEGTDFRKAIFIDAYTKELQKWYVTHWGGIHGNGQDTLDNFAKSSDERLIANGKAGIASWSKMLCLRNPGEYAIFDARVAISLNLIQKKYKVKDKYLFPHLPSKNKTITAAHKALKSDPEFTQLKRNGDFYKRYLKILKDCAKQANSDIQTVEMVLFCHAATLSAMP